MGPDYAKVVELIEANWQEFVSLFNGNEEEAEDTLNGIKRHAGML